LLINCPPYCRGFYTKPDHVDAKIADRFRIYCIACAARNAHGGTAQDCVAIGENNIIYDTDTSSIRCGITYLKYKHRYNCK